MRTLEPFAFTIIFPGGTYRLTVIPTSISEERATYAIEMDGVGMGVITRIDGSWYPDEDCKFNQQEIDDIGQTIILTHSC